jgi:hypothetical protein
MAAVRSSGVGIAGAGVPSPRCSSRHGGFGRADYHCGLRRFGRKPRRVFRVIRPPASGHGHEPSAPRRRPAEPRNPRLISACSKRRKPKRLARPRLCRARWGGPSTALRAGARLRFPRIARCLFFWRARLRRAAWHLSSGWWFGLPLRPSPPWFPKNSPRLFRERGRARCHPRQPCCEEWRRGFYPIGTGETK